MEDLKRVIKSSNNMQNVYKHIKEYNSIRGLMYVVVIVLDDVIVIKLNMNSNKKLNRVATELFIRRIIFLSNNLISHYQKMLNWTVQMFLLWKFQSNFYQSHLIINQTLTLKILWIFKKKYSKVILLFSYWYYSCIR